ncbi:MAG: SWIM zinc finger family protein [Deltaproteobacteria bacterium]|nr:SWIM zinc finger family protein [Deltaproteobacteria bacterium]
MTNKRKRTDPFAELPWADLSRWAGCKIVGRGRDYQSSGSVTGLARMRDGGLVAWVEGSRRYATLVDRDAGGSLHSTCTCPYEGVCKHAVAVVLEYLQCLERETPVPLAHESDERFGKFARFEDDDDDVPTGYLRKLSGLLKKLDREAEWKACLAQLKVTHARKRRLMEILDILEEKPILKTV